MVKQTYTNGPWKATHDAVWHIDKIDFDSDSHYPGDIATIWDTYDNAEQNAKLISKAPELYEMLNKIVNEVENPEQLGKVLDEATELLKEIF